MSAPGPIAVLVPIKAFHLAKHRLAGVLDPGERSSLARELAAGVIRAAAPLPVFVACENDEVAGFAEALGAGVLRTDADGLNSAVTEGVAELSRLGFGAVCIVHGDLPDIVSLRGVTDHDGITLVPDNATEGTNVICVPTGQGFRFSYGVGSFARHLAEARRTGLPIRIVRDQAMAFDVDTSDDLQATRPPNRPILQPSGATSMHLDLPVPRRAMAIAAHPDDVEFQCGATLAKWAAAGCIVDHLICTDGSKGTWDLDADTEELVSLRATEQLAAAKALGATGQVWFLGAVDGELAQTRDHVSAIARFIRERRPDVVFAHDPWRRWRLHPDHRAAGFLACDAVVAARDPHFFPEHGVAHHRPDAMLLFECEEPDLVCDVTGFEGYKVDALLAHESQYETTMDIATVDDQSARRAFDARIRAEMAAVGDLVGVASGEAFKRMGDL